MKSLNIRFILPAIIAVSTVLLPLAPALASNQQIFYFNDDFSTAFSIDPSQSISVQNANGDEYLVVGARNGTLTSTIVNSVNGTISAATINADDVQPQATYINFYLSNDNGVTWYKVQPGYEFRFPHPGSQLRWRAYFDRSFIELDPVLESISIGYTIVGDFNSSNQYTWQQTGSSFSLNSFLMDPQQLVCSGLALIGMSCNATVTTTSSYNVQPLNFFGETANATADISSAVDVKDLNGDAINLVKTPNSPNIYELKQGRKHLFPNLTIFASYGYDLNQVQTISQNQLDKYPRAYLMRVQGDSKDVYYLTEGGMLRLLPNDDKVLASYGDRPEDIITIDQQEFNFYPVDQYVFQETPLNRDVFQLTQGGKRYLTPMAVRRLGITSDQVAPINQTELDWYKTLAPVVQ